MLIGYARVSTIAQNLDRQLGALAAARCERIFEEKASGKNTRDRPELEKAIKTLGAGDVLLVAEWHRATRSMIDGIEIMQRVAARGASIKVLDSPHLDLTTTMGKGILTFLSAIAQDERERIVKMSKDGQAAARTKGKKFGRPAALTDHQKEIARQMLATGEGVRAVGRHFDVSHSVISRLR